MSSAGVVSKLCKFLPSLLSLTYIRKGQYGKLPCMTAHHENIPIFDPLKPHFYIVKLGFTGVDIIFLISIQNIDCGYSLEPPRRGGSNEYPQSMF